MVPSAMSGPSPLPPEDPALDAGRPIGSTLRDAIAAVDGAPLGDRDDIEVRYLEHDPGVRRTLLVRVTESGRTRHAAVFDVAGRSTELSWYPDDPRLPGLADGWESAAARWDLPSVPPDPLAWVPGRRMVIAAGDRVVKFHADRQETEFALVAAESAGLAVDVPDVLAVDLERATHVQQRIAGTQIGGDDALATTDAAAELLRSLRACNAPVPTIAPEDVVDSCRSVARLVAWYTPANVTRIDAVVARLSERIPTGLDPVVSHGDFNVGQLIRTDDGRLVVVDIDTLCLAPAAFDVASYAANLVSGRVGDLDRATAVLDALADAYGGHLPGLDWYFAAMLLRRLDRAIRRSKRRWPERTERALTDLESVVARL